MEHTAGLATAKAFGTIAAHLVPFTGEPCRW